MHLTLRAQSLSNEPLTQAIVGEFDERGGTIGRSDSNTMTLPDPQRHVSRLQAEVLCAHGEFSIRNVGSSNPILLNGRPLNPGESARLGDDDHMVIGGYALHVELGRRGHGDRAAGRSAVDARTVIRASAREGKTTPPGDSRPPLASTVDPFADLLGPSVVPAGAPAPAAFAPAAVAARLPDDFDPFADPATRPPSGHGERPLLADPFDLGGVGAQAAPQREAGPGEDALIPHAQGPGALDQAFGLSVAPSGSADPLAAFLAQPSPTQACAGGIDPFADLLGDAAARQAVGPALPNHTPELHAAFQPPAVRPPPAPRAPKVDRARAEIEPRLAAVPPKGMSSAQDEVLWAAFCEGAAVQIPGQQRLTPEMMRMLGRLLRAALEGTVQLTAVRTTAKQELRVPVTTIQARENNPLKFAPHAKAALAQLLQPPVQGFMEGPEAMEDAMADLLGHAVGTMAGTRAAMRGMLERFEPARLEAQLGGGGVLDKLLPMNRQARLWELYLQHYERLSEAAREDFQELFGRAFVKAYEEQADRIAAARKSSR
jgi:FHA domain-containing protein